MIAYTVEQLKIIKQHSVCNKAEILTSYRCGCFECQEIFSPSKISCWLQEKSANFSCGENMETAICPNCGFDFVIGDAIGIDITKKLLFVLNTTRTISDSELREFENKIKSRSKINMEFFYSE